VGLRGGIDDDDDVRCWRGDVLDPSLPGVAPFFLAAACDIILSRTFLMLEAAIAALSRRGGEDVDESERGVRR
jgi:hypothetical protein